LLLLGLLSSLVAEVGAVEVFLILIFLLVFDDVVLEKVPLCDENSDVFISDAVCLSRDALVERQVLDVRFLGLDLDSRVIHFLLECVLLPRQVLLRLEGHADLSKLEDDFEVGEEWDHISGGAWVGDSFKEATFSLLEVHVHVLGHLLDPLFLKNRWVAPLNRLSEGLCVGENVFTFVLECSIWVSQCERADKIDDL